MSTGTGTGSSRRRDGDTVVNGDGSSSGMGPGNRRGSGNTSMRAVLNKEVARRLIRHGVGRDQWQAGLIQMEGLASEQTNMPDSDGTKAGRQTAAGGEAEGQRAGSGKRKSDVLDGTCALELDRHTAVSSE